MWMEYVNKALKNGQQVFRRSVIENLMLELESTPKSQGDSKAVADLKREIGILTKQLQDCQRANRQARAVLDDHNNFKSAS